MDARNSLFFFDWTFLRQVNQSWTKATLVLVEAFSGQNNGKKAWQTLIR
jgi:hypothetical protein